MIDQEKILLALLPFWTPQIPPLGISCLKSFLQQKGFNVKTIDVNVNETFNDIYNEYFEVLKEYVPGDKRGNFYNIGNDVLKNHMMAHFNHTGEEEYLELVKTLVRETYFCDIDRPCAFALSKVIGDFYNKLENCVTKLLEDEKPSVLGLSVFSGTLPASLFVFKLVKKKWPHIKTVMGGGIFADQLDVGSPNFEFFLEKTPYIDKIIVGEGELLMLEFLRGRLPDSRRVYTLKDIDGKTLDLDTAGIPDFSDFDPAAYPSLAFYVSRSCPFQCAFCSETVQWGKYRKKSAKQVVEQLKQLHRQYNLQLFLMGDSLLNPVVGELANELTESGIAIYWDGYLRADKPVCDIENTLLWRRGGFYRARLGLESGSQRVLEMMGKKISPPQIRAAVSALAYAGIKTTTYWVVGYPGETEDDFQQTLTLIEELKSSIYEAECNPFNYHLTGQVNSHRWATKNKPVLLYPREARDMLVTQTWRLDCEPSREEIYNRVVRFVRHCKKLDIPNPYSINEIFLADERWKKLHKNAVSSLLDFKNTHAYIDDAGNVKKLSFVRMTQQDNKDWDF